MDTILDRKQLTFISPSLLTRTSLHPKTTTQTGNARTSAISDPRRCPSNEKPPSRPLPRLRLPQTPKKKSKTTKSARTSAPSTPSTPGIPGGWTAEKREALIEELLTVGIKGSKGAGIAAKVGITPQQYKDATQGGKNNLRAKVIKAAGGFGK